MGESFIAGITAITALIATVINLLSKIGSIKKSKEAKREEDYYNKILIPFLKFYHKGEAGKNAIHFLKERDVDNPYIPPYIRYVYYNKAENETKRAEQLQKLLIIDYVKLYENEDRAIDRFIKVTERIGKVGNIVCFLIVFVMSLFIDFALTYTLIEQCCMNQKDVLKIVACAVSLLFFLLLTVASILIISSIIKNDTDMYSTKQDKINKEIAELDIKYNRIDKKHYF